MGCGGVDKDGASRPDFGHLAALACRYERAFERSPIAPKTPSATDARVQYAYGHWGDRAGRQGRR